jgi:hypothetical protein
MYKINHNVHHEFITFGTANEMTLQAKETNVVVQLSDLHCVQLLSNVSGIPFERPYERVLKIGFPGPSSALNSYTQETYSDLDVVF